MSGAWDYLMGLVQSRLHMLSGATLRPLRQHGLGNPNYCLHSLSMPVLGYLGVCVYTYIYIYIYINGVWGCLTDVVQARLHMLGWEALGYQATDCTYLGYLC